MPVEESIKLRIVQLIDEGGRLSKANDGNGIDSERKGQCLAWLISAQGLIHRICELPDDLYRTHVDRLLAEDVGWSAHVAVQEVAPLLRQLLRDAQQGLVASVADHARAEVFDSFLDHAEAYIAADRKNEAGAIVGVVFEDSIRRICRKRSILERDAQLDSLISALATGQVITAAKAKRARAAAHVRTKATHAQWDEFAMEDVKAAVVLTRELIETKLDA